MSEETAPEDARPRDAARIVEEILARMEIPAKVEAKPLADGNISLSVSPDAPIPGVPNLKRSPFSDALQYLANKLLNRPGAEKRWITLGIGGHREPKPSGQGAKPAKAPAAPGRTAKPAREARPRQEVAEEPSLEVEPDPVLAAAAEAMAKGAAAQGRPYAIFGMSPQVRAVVVQACAEVSEVRVSAVGEGRCRRVVFSPAHPVPMPRRKSPLDVDDEEI